MALDLYAIATTLFMTWHGPLVALSGGYSRDDANAKLKQNVGMIASFSRALTEGLSASQSDDQFNAALGSAIDSIFDASRAS